MTLLPRSFRPSAFAVAAAVFIQLTSVAGPPASSRSQGLPDQSVIDLPINKLTKAIPELRGLEPASSQDQLHSVLEKAGASVSEFFKLFPSTTSDELVREQRFRSNGTVDESIAEQFRYLALARPDQGITSLEEYRTNDKGEPLARQRMRGAQMLTQGFVSSAGVFHPDYQAESRFRYLGKQLLNGRLTEVVAFAQNPERVLRAEQVETGSSKLTISVQGIAWLDATRGQALLLRSDLLHPYAQIHLDRQTTEVEFEEVRFRQLRSPLWLPSKVVVTVVWDGQMFRNIHSYSNYRLFNVETHEEINAPK